MFDAVMANLVTYFFRPLYKIFYLIILCCRRRRRRRRLVVNERFNQRGV